MNPHDIYEYMLATNDSFKIFVEHNKNKTTEQIAKEYNIKIYKDLKNV